MQKKLIPFNSLQILDKEEKDKNLQIMSEFMDHGQFIGGEAIDLFESNISKYLKINFCLGVSSGTGALYLALKCLDLKPGDEIIVPAISWISTALAPQELGLQVVFADVLDNLTIDPESVEKLITKKTKAIVTVDFMGHPTDIDKLKTFDLPIIEDSSQAFGTKINNKFSGTRGDFGCFSLNPMKQLGALGDAGIIVTNNEENYDRLKRLRYCGMQDREINIESSLNFRMDPLQAAFLTNRLTHFNKSKQKRRDLYDLYISELPKNIKYLEMSADYSLYGFTIFSKMRDELVAYLRENNIETKIQHQPMICDQHIFKKCRKDVKNASVKVKEILSLPFYTNMSHEHVITIARSIGDFYGQ